MALTTAQQDLIVKTVVGVFDAAPGAAYLNLLAPFGSNQAGLVTALVGTDAFKAIYPDFYSNEQFATKFLNALVGSTVSDTNKANVAAYAAALLNGGASRANVVLALINALDKVDPVANPDWAAASTAYHNQVTVAKYYSIDQLGSATSVSTLQSVIAGVTDTTDVSTPTAIENAIANAGSQTFTLTTAIDSIVGTGGNDLIIGTMDNTGSSPVNTFSIGDSIDGGAGVDTLKLTLASTSDLDLRTTTISNVEKLVVVDTNYDLSGSAYLGTNTFTDVTFQGADWVDVYGINEGTNANATIANGAEYAGVYYYFDNTDAATVTMNDTVAGAKGVTGYVEGEFYHGYNNGSENGLANAQTINATLNLKDTQLVNGDGEGYAYQYIYAANTGNAGAKINTVVNLTNNTSDGTDYGYVEQVIYQTGDATVNSVINITDSADFEVEVYANDNGSVTANAANNTVTVNLSNATSTYGDAYVGAYGYDTVTINVAAKSNVDDGVYFYESDSTSADTNSQTLTINAAADFSTYETELNSKGSTATVVKGAGNVDLGYYYASGSSTLSSTVKASIDASALTGNLTVDVEYDISSLKGGSGNDTVTLNHTLTAGHIIDGGAGTDSLDFNNVSGTLIAQDYALINGTVLNFEQLEFQNGVTLDVSKLTGTYNKLTFDENSTVTKVSQDLVAYADLDATTTGYSSSTTPHTYAGALNVTSLGDGTLTLQGASAAVTVNGGTSDSSVDVTVAGDLQTLSIATANAKYNATTDSLTTVDLTVATHTAGGLGALTSVTLTGNGTVSIDDSNSTGLDSTGANAFYSASSLTTVDASQLGGTLAYGANKGNITGGLNFVGNQNVAQSIKLGSGTDTIDLNLNDGVNNHLASTYAKMDTITGFDAVKETADAKSTTDVLKFAGLVLDGATANAGIEKITIDTSVYSTLALAFTHAAAVSNTDTKVVQFSYGGDTYLFSDATGATAGQLDNADLAVKLVGTVDLTTAFAVHA